MANVFKVGESGKLHRVNAGFDLSSRTDLSLTYTKPDGTVVTKTELGGEVSLGISPVVDPDLGSLSANEYVEYEIEPGFLDQANTSTASWKVYLTYTNTTPTPDDVFIGDCSTFTVNAVCP